MSGGYSDGDGVEFHRKAAEQGVALAQFSLGACYAKGNGVPKDATEGVKWYRKAAEQGDANAQRYADHWKEKPLKEVIARISEKAEQGGARQPTTAPDPKSEGNKKPKPESEGRSQ